jgi:hypothetical protein
MPIAVHPKPKVLFIGHSSGSPEHDAKIREVAEVHCITGMSYEESIPVIADVVERHGPFVAFGVSRPHKESSGRTALMVGLVRAGRQVPHEMGLKAAGTAGA